MSSEPKTTPMIARPQNAILRIPLGQTLPLQLRFGLLLLAISLPLNALLPGLRTHFLFFPIWLGYSLTVDGLTYLRKGSSLLSRNWKRYIFLFILSAPAWWLFELINKRTVNWQYVPSDHFGPFAYFCYATSAFSTVIPAIFGTAELVSTSAWIRRIPRGPRIPLRRPVPLLFFITGWTMLALLLIWPTYFYALVWLSLYFILEPINVWLRNRTLAAHSATGNWQPIIAVWLGALITGFHYEFFNSMSSPYWIYITPGVAGPYLWQMPLLGYGGYLPFAMELYALYALASGLLKLSHPAFIQLGTTKDDSHPA